MNSIKPWGLNITGIAFGLISERDLAHLLLTSDFLEGNFRRFANSSIKFSGIGFYNNVRICRAMMEKGYCQLAAELERSGKPGSVYIQSVG